MRIGASFPWAARIVLFALVCMTWSGCTTQKIDWAARVGTYTYDQAVQELGPPAKQAKLQNGDLVADWLTQRGERHYYYPPYGGYGFYHPGYAPYAGPMVTTTPDYFIRLTFDPAGRLKDWKKVVQ